MARGRMLNRTVCKSKKFHDLPDDTCRLLASWCIPNLDIRGVFHADPTTVRSLVFPRRDDVTSDIVRGYLDAMEATGLIVRFVSGGEVWQYWPGFEHNQIGIRYDRESPEYPPPPGLMPDFVPLNTGQNPAEVKVKLNRKEEKIKKEGACAPAPEQRHPAIDIYRSKARVFPDKTAWPSIEAEIPTDEKSLDRWGKTVEAYIVVGWNKRNIRGMLDFFGRNEIPGANGKYSHDNSSPTTPSEPTISIAERAIQISRARRDAANVKL
jgi:hypothetical protein